MKFTDSNYKKLKSNYLKYYKNSNSIGEYFGGPSLYFHIKALQERKKRFLGIRHLEYIYATLTSWGMHRMGETKTKMVGFKEFHDSIVNKKKEINHFRKLKIEKLSTGDIEKLCDICFDLKVSQSESKLVGNSKALAHILPDIVPPIDRQYTLLFFQNEPENILKKEGKLYQPVLNHKYEREYFNKIINKTLDFVKCVKADKNIKIDNKFNTSYPKIFDNLIITYIRNFKKAKSSK